MKTRFIVTIFTVLLVVSVFVPAAYAGGIHIKSARIGCLDIQHAPNLTPLVKRHCEGKYSCIFKAPTPQEYHAAGVQAKTRLFCSQAMEIKYDCENGVQHTVTIPGDAWKHNPAVLKCVMMQSPGSQPHGPNAKGLVLNNGVVNQLLNSQKSPVSIPIIKWHFPPCNGPDPTPKLKAVSVTPLGGGNYDVKLITVIYNVGKTVYRSGMNQQEEIITNESGQTVYSGLWPSSGWSHGELLPDHYLSGNARIVHFNAHNEFPESYTLKLVYDPDIRSDGNPENDDCNLDNNTYTLSASQIE